jgi:hypothetical protein
MYYKKYRLVVSSIEGVQLFDIESDPTQINSIWPIISSDLRCIFIQDIYTKKYLLKTWQAVTMKKGDEGCFDDKGIIFNAKKLN